MAYVCGRGRDPDSYAQTLLLPNVRFRGCGRHICYLISRSHSVIGVVGMLMESMNCACEEVLTAWSVRPDKSVSCTYVVTQKCYDGHVVLVKC